MAVSVSTKRNRTERKNTTGKNNTTKDTDRDNKESGKKHDKKKDIDQGTNGDTDIIEKEEYMEESGDITLEVEEAQSATRTDEM